MLHPSGCTKSFSPDGAGIDDTFFINNTGKAEIFNINGQLVRTLNVPANWDGKNSAGETVLWDYTLSLLTDPQQQKL